VTMAPSAPSAFPTSGAFHCQPPRGLRGRGASSFRPGGGSVRTFAADATRRAAYSPQPIRRSCATISCTTAR
jgi:hypothetical protein